MLNNAASYRSNSSSLCLARQAMSPHHMGGSADIAEIT